MAGVVAALVAGTVGGLPALGASASTAPRPTAAAPASAHWRTVFSDRFAGPAGSRAGAKWAYDVGTQYKGSPCPANWGTGEVETARASTANVRRDGHGHLVIRALDSGGRWTSGRIPCAGCQAGYHTYSVIVNRRTSNESITWYLDGKAYFTVTESQVGTATWQAAVDHGFFLILDVAMGGSFPNGVCGCTSPTSATTPGAAMKVQYVKVLVR